MISIKERMIGDQHWVSPRNGEFSLLNIDENNKVAYYHRVIKQKVYKNQYHTTHILEIVRWTDKVRTYPGDNSFGNRGYCIPIERIRALREYYIAKYSIPLSVLDDLDTSIVNYTSQVR